VTVSGISVNVPNTFSSALNAELVSGANSVSDACSFANGGPFISGTAYVAPLTGNHFFPVASIVGRIWGQDQDGTAAQVFEFNPPTCSNALTATVPAVLVTNGSYQDALSASYLAGQLGTGILTTNTNTVSPEALQALALTGVTQVFVVGGPLVVSPADITQLENTPSYRCGTGGVTPRLNALGQTRNLVVQQIFGQTADDTAGAVATFAGAGVPGSRHFPAAYGGAYNDTSGSSGSPVSSAPDTNVATAILATDQSFTDAASASAVAYTSHFPLVLTGQDTLSPAAAEALTNDSIQQLLVMGGPIAISDNVVNQVEAMGITVLRIAGQDFTDTSQLLARFELASTNSIGGPPSGLDYDTFYLSVARGDYYTDAIVVSRVSVGVPILLTWDPNNTSQPGGTDYLGTFLTAAGQGLGLDIFGQDGTINNLLLAGGTFAISNPLATTLGHDLNG
jgi:putative cell wall-binding protein